jgi:hypothetical protein
MGPAVTAAAVTAVAAAAAVAQKFDFFLRLRISRDPPKLPRRVPLRESRFEFLFRSGIPGRVNRGERGEHW